MLTKLRKRLEALGPKLSEKTFDSLRLSGPLNTRLSARYGYGLTLQCDGQQYLFHLPDVADNANQAALLKRKDYPTQDILLRLRRRTHPDSVIMEACAGFGIRTLFYAMSMKAERIYALVGLPDTLKLLRKNVVLNEQEGAVRSYLMNMGEEKHKNAYTGFDRVCKDQKIDRIDLLSVNSRAVDRILDGGADTLLATLKPAMIFWARDACAAQREAVKTKMLEHGYTAPEPWTSDILYWVPRI